MTNMFKKTLIAAAVLSVCGVANAATLGATKIDASSQYLNATDATFITANVVTLTMQANYAINDNVKFTATAPFTVSTLPNTLEFLIVNDQPAITASCMNGTTAISSVTVNYFDTGLNSASTVSGSVSADCIISFTLPGTADLNSPVTVANTANPAVETDVVSGDDLSTSTFGYTKRAAVAAVPGKSGVVLSLISTNVEGAATTATEANYRVTAIENGTLTTPTTIGNTFTLSGLRFPKAGLASGASLSFSATTNTNLPLDTTGGAARTAALIDVKNQFTTKTAPSFTREIDVEQQRRDFTLVSGNRSVIGTVTLTQGTFNLSRDITKVTHTVHGDFSWVRDTDTTTGGIQSVVFTPACAGGTASAAVITALSYTFECNTAGNASVLINPEATGQKPAAPAVANAIATQDLTFSSVATYAGPVGTETLLDKAAAGSWTLNGSQVYIPYMLYGNTAEQTIQLTNKGAQVGDIFATVVVNGQSIDLGKVGVAAARSVTSLNAAIRTAMVAKGVSVTGANFAVGLTLVSNVPAADVTVYSAYTRAGSSRLVVVNDSNGK